MNSRVSWSVEGIDPSVRERAEAAARRAGMSLDDWLNSSIGDTAQPDFRAPYDQPQQAMPRRRPAPSTISTSGWIPSPARSNRFRSPRRAPRRHRDEAAARAEPAVARQLNDAISRLDARLSQISNPAPRQTQMQDRQRQAEMVERAASQVYRPSPPLSPASLDFAIAEIAARQNELDAPAPGRCRRAARRPERDARRHGPADGPDADGARRRSRRRRRVRIFPRWNGI